MPIGYSSNGFEGEGSHRFTRRSGLEGTVDGLRGGSRDIPDWGGYSATWDLGDRAGGSSVTTRGGVLDLNRPPRCLLKGSDSYSDPKKSETVSLLQGRLEG